MLKNLIVLVLICSLLFSCSSRTERREEKNEEAASTYILNGEVGGISVRLRLEGETLSKSSKTAHSVTRLESAEAGGAGLLGIIGLIFGGGTGYGIYKLLQDWLLKSSFARTVVAGIEESGSDDLKSTLSKRMDRKHKELVRRIKG